MPNTYTLISSVTVGAGGASSITFSSIPQTYTDLVIKHSVRGVSANTSYTRLQFNSTTVTTAKNINGSGSAANSYSYSDWYRDIAGQDVYLWTANTFSNGELYIPNYTNSSIYKSISTDSVTENNATAAYSGFTAGLWSNTAAITSITIVPGDPTATDTFAQHSTAYLYGISKS